MQLGTRWNVGGEPPARLPEPLREAIAEAERGFGAADVTAWRWTLTWLEGRPVVELDAPGGPAELDGRVLTTG